MIFSNILSKARIMLSRFCSIIHKTFHMYHVLWPEYDSQSKQAQDFQIFLSNKILEMDRDPFTNDSDWRKLLPVCKYADEWFTNTHPFCKDFTGQEYAVAMMLKDEDSEVA